MTRFVKPSNQTGVLYLLVLADIKLLPEVQYLLAHAL